MHERSGADRRGEVITPMIKLTYMDGTPIWLRASSVWGFYRIGDLTHVRAEDQIFKVSETPEQILRLVQ